MRTIDELLAEAPAFEGMAPAQLELIAGCAHNEVFEKGAFLLREGDTANVFYVLRSGRVKLEAHAAQRGALSIETIEKGDLLGWSWLVPPYKKQYDARVVKLVRGLLFDGKRIRALCEADPKLGYALLMKFSKIMSDRLWAARIQIMDIYAKGS